MLVSLGVAVAVWYGSEQFARVWSICFPDREHFMALVGASFVFAFFGTFVPMLKKFSISGQFARTRCGAREHLRR